MDVTLFPGWDSVEAAARWHRAFEAAGFAALGLLLLFEVLAYIYGSRRDALVLVAEKQTSAERRRQHEQADREREQAEQRHNAEVAEANKKAVNAQAEAEQLRQQAVPRTLSPMERRKITAFLTGKPVGTFVIDASIAAGDARTYAEQIADVFTAAGWTVTINDVMFSGPDMTGLWITVKDGNMPPEAAGLLLHALSVAGIKAHGEYDPTFSDPITLSIGAK